MKSWKLAVVLGALLVVGLVSYSLGRLTAPVETWADQHRNLSSDPKEFRNSFLGLTLRVPKDDNWRLLWRPQGTAATAQEDKQFEFKYPVPPNVNKVLEMERMLEPSGSDKQWARMDLFVEPFPKGAQADGILAKLQFRDKRPDLRLGPPQQFAIGSQPGSVSDGAWSVAKKKFRLVTYWVDHEDKLYVFSGVTQDEAFGRFRPVFDQIVASVRLR